MANFTPVGVIAEVRGFGEFQGKLGQMGSAIGGVAKTAGKLAVAGFAAMGAAAAGVATASVAAAISFESAWAGVVKTTEGLTDEMGNLTAAGEEVQQGFRDLAKEVPTSVEELLKIGELGGQLGIAQDSLVDFTRTIAAMGEATNLTTEEAATGFAQIANIMQTPQEQIENMGSSIVALGNNFATTERDILNFAQRIAGAGQIAGVAEADIFGISAAFASVGIEAEAGGTAVQKVLLGMNQAILEGGDQLEIFSATAGMTAEEFGNLWEEDAGDAFLSFVEGLGVAGDDAMAILSALGLEDQRLTRAFLSLAGAGDLLNDSLITSRIAFNENTALTKEAEQRYRTTESQLKIFKNTIKDLGITIGSALLPFLNKLLEAAKPLLEEFGRQLPDLLNNVLIPAIRDVATWIGENLPIAIQFLSNFWTTILQPALAQFWVFVTGTLIPVLQQVFTWLSANLPVAIAVLSEFWTGTLQPALATVWEFIQSSIIPVLQQFAAWLGENLPAAVQFLSNLWTNTLRPAIQGILPIIQAVIDWVAANWPTFQAIVQTVIEAIRDVVIPVVTEWVTFIIQKVQEVVTWVQTNWPLIQETIDTVLTTIKNIVTAALNAIHEFWVNHGDTIMTLIRTIWDFIKVIIDNAITAIKGIIQAVMYIINGNWTEAWNTIKSTAETIWNGFMNFLKDSGPALWEIIRNIVRQIPEIILSIGGKLLEVGRKIVEKLKEGIASAWDSLVSWFGDKLEGLTSWLPFSEPKIGPKSPLYGLSRAGEAIVTNIATGMQSAIGQMDAVQMKLAYAARQAAAQSAVTPASAVAGASVSVVNNFNASINGGMDQSTFETGVLRVVERAIGQFS